MIADRLPSAFDPLIAEARRRARHRQFAAAALVALALAALAVVVFRPFSRTGSGSSAGIVPSGVSQIEIRSSFPQAPAAAAYSVTDPAKVVRITTLLNRLDARRATYDKGYGLAVAGVPHNQMCAATGGPTASLKLENASGTVLASASFVTGDGFGGLSAACNPLWFGRGQSALPGTTFFHPQFALAGSNWRRQTTTNFARALETVIGRPICQRDVGVRAQYCKP